MPTIRSLLLACACTTLLAACSEDGYYDNRGHYHPEGAANAQKSATVVDTTDGSSWYYNGRTYRTKDNGKNYYTDNSARKGDSAGVMGYDRNKDATLSDSDNDVTIVYNRYGYYDTAGTYYPVSKRPRVNRSYFPNPGMCRVWLDGVAPQDQPPVESCDGVQFRAPIGSYIMYGG